MYLRNIYKSIGQRSMITLLGTDIISKPICTKNIERYGSG